MNALLTLGSFSLTKYGLLAAASVALFWILGYVWLRRHQVTNGKAVLWMSLTLVFGWLVSRLVFVACNFAYYADELNGYWAPALNFWDGGYSMTGMLLGVMLGAVLAALFSGARKEDMLNAAGFGVLPAIALLRLAEFLCDTEASGDIGEGKYLEGIDWLDGLLTNAGMVMQADGDMVYPACLAECAVMLLLFTGLVIWLISRHFEVPCADCMSVTLLLSGAAQLVLEQLRDDGHLVFHFVHLQQVIALAFCVAVLIVWTKRFLSAETKQKTLPVVWIVSVVCIGLAVLACFGIDRWESKTLAWLLLIIPTAAMTVSALYLRIAANYLTGEE